MKIELNLSLVDLLIFQLNILYFWNHFQLVLNMSLIINFILFNLRFILLQKVAASKFLRLRLLLVRCEIQLSFRLKNILIYIYIIKCIFISWTWKKDGIFEGDGTFFWYESIEHFVFNEVILSHFIIFWRVAWNLVAFLFISLLIANVKITQDIAWNWFEWLSFVPFLTQVFIIFFFYYLFVLNSLYFLWAFYFFKILQELFIIAWYLNILVGT